MANIIIVGANQGIGYYIAERLLARGHSVAILDTSLDQAKALQASYPQRLLPVCADARDAASIQSGVAQTVTAFGSIDAAIHNACLCTFASEPDTGYDVYQDVLDVNFFGALRLAKAVLPYMRKAGKGRIIFTSSGVGVTGFVNISPYASSKGAIEALAKCLEIENQPYGISFHLFHPPLTNTASAAGLPIPKEGQKPLLKVFHRIFYCKAPTGRRNQTRPTGHRCNIRALSAKATGKSSKMFPCHSRIDRPYLISLGTCS